MGIIWGTGLENSLGTGEYMLRVMPRGTSRDIGEGGVSWSSGEGGMCLTGAWDLWAVRPHQATEGVGHKERGRPAWGGRGGGEGPAREVGGKPADWLHLKPRGERFQNEGVVDGVKGGKT